MARKVSDEILKKLTENVDLANLDYEKLLLTIREDELISPWLPEREVRIDPRNGERILYSTARARRPITTMPTSEEDKPEERDEESCPLCNGDTTSFIDVMPLSQGHTLINKNLYPALYPFAVNENFEQDQVVGSHFLQWSSTIHGQDIHTMSQADGRIVIDRLALLEMKLLHQNSNDEHKGFVGIIKNYGFLAGGSLSHGHQQVVHSNVMPRKIVEDYNYLEKHNEPFAQFLNRRNDSSLTVMSFSSLRVVVPYFMTRPLQCLLLFEDSSACNLHDLNDNERDSLVRAMRTILLAITSAMRKMGRLPCYNLVVHSGPIGQLYIEIHPYTQELAGLEHLGLYVCQDTPENSAKELRLSMENETI